MKMLITFLLSIAGLLYAFSIVLAGVHSLQQTPILNDLLITAVVLIGGVLSTNLGAVLGVTFTPPQAPTPRPGGLGGNAPRDSSPSKPSFLLLRPSFGGSRPARTLEGPTQETINTPQRIQIIACWIYLGSLLLALIFWLIGLLKNIPNDKMVLIPDLVKTLLGVLAGSITVALGRNQS